MVLIRTSLQIVILKTMFPYAANYPSNSKTRDFGAEFLANPKLPLAKFIAAEVRANSNLIVLSLKSNDPVDSKQYLSRTTDISILTSCGVVLVESCL